MIVVVEELQGANDPVPWWTHVSIKQTGDDLRSIPGNLLKLRGRGSVTATWNGNEAVTILVEDSLYTSQVSSHSTEKQGVQINFRRASDRTDSNSEQVGGGNAPELPSHSSAAPPKPRATP